MAFNVDVNIRTKVVGGKNIGRDFARIFGTIPQDFSGITKQQKKAGKEIMTPWGVTTVQDFKTNIAAIRAQALLSIRQFRQMMKGSALPFDPKTGKFMTIKAAKDILGYDPTDPQIKAKLLAGIRQLKLSTKAMLRMDADQVAGISGLRMVEANALATANQYKIPPQTDQTRAMKQLMYAQMFGQLDAKQLRMDKDEIAKIKKGISESDKVVQKHAKSVDNMNNVWVRFRHQGVWRIISSIRNSILLLTFSMGMLVAVIAKAITNAKMYENAMTGLSTIAMKTGQSLTATKQAAISLTSDGLWTVTEAATALKNLLATGFSLPEAIKLLKGFKDSASFARQASLGFGESIVGATEGLKNNNPILMDNAGLTKNMSVILKEVGVSTEEFGRLAEDSGTRTKVLNGLLKELSLFGGDAQKMLNTYSGSLAKFNAQSLQASIEIGQMLQPALKEFLKILSDIIAEIRSINKEFKDIFTQRLTTALKFIGNLLKGIVSTFVALNNIVERLGKFMHSDLGSGLVTLLGMGMLGRVMVAPKLRVAESAKVSGRALTGELSRLQSLQGMEGISPYQAKELGSLIVLQKDKIRDFDKAAKGLEKTTFRNSVAMAGFSGILVTNRTTLQKAALGLRMAGKEATFFNKSLFIMGTMGRKAAVAIGLLGGAIKGVAMSILRFIPVMAAFMALDLVIGWITKWLGKAEEAKRKIAEFDEASRQKRVESLQETIAQLEILKEHAVTLGNIKEINEQIIKTQLQQKLVALDLKNIFISTYADKFKLGGKGFAIGGEGAEKTFANTEKGYRDAQKYIQAQIKASDLMEEYYRSMVTFEAGAAGRKEFTKKADAEIAKRRELAKVNDDLRETLLGLWQEETKVNMIWKVGDETIKKHEDTLRDLQAQMESIGKVGYAKVYTDARNEAKKYFDEVFNKEKEGALKEGRLTSAFGWTTESEKAVWDAIFETATKEQNEYYTKLLESGGIQIAYDMSQRIKQLKHEIAIAFLPEYAKQVADYRFELDQLGWSTNKVNEAEKLYQQTLKNKVNMDTTNEIMDLTLEYQLLTGSITKGQIAQREYNKDISKGTSPALARWKSDIKDVIYQLKLLKEYQEKDRQIAAETSQKKWERGIKRGRSTGDLQSQLATNQDLLRMTRYTSMSFAEGSAQAQEYAEKIRVLEERIQYLRNALELLNEKGLIDWENIFMQGFENMMSQLNEAGDMLAEVWSAIPRQVKEAQREVGDLYKAGEITVAEHQRRMAEIEHQALLARQSAYIEFADAVVLQTIRMIIIQIQQAMIQKMIAGGLKAFTLGSLLPIFGLAIGIAAMGALSGAIKGNNPTGNIGAGGAGTSGGAGANRNATSAIQAPIQNLTVIPTLTLYAEDSIYVGSGTVEEFSSIVGDRMVSLINDAVSTGEISLKQK
jgi:hypothetical protein